MNFPKHFSLQTIQRLETELSLPIRDKVKLLLVSLGLSQGALSELTGIPSGTIATLARRDSVSHPTNIILNRYLRDTAQDRYVIERARARVFDTLKK